MQGREEGVDSIGRSTWKSISGVLIGNIEQFGWPTRAPEIKDPSAAERKRVFKRERQLPRRS